jgi:hypothetical protein
MLAVGIAGYFLFGTAVNGNVLNSFTAFNLAVTMVSNALPK